MLWSDLLHQLINIKELERLRQLSRDMMKRLEPIDELTIEINEMKTERTRTKSMYHLCASTDLLQERKQSRNFNGYPPSLCKVITQKHTKT